MSPEIQLTIRDIRARTLNVPLSRPMQTAAGPIASEPVVLIDVATREGYIGRSYLRAYTTAAHIALARLVYDIGVFLAGQSAAPHSVERLLRGHFRLLGTDGLVGMAIGGIDIALWDVRAKVAEQPLVIMLGGQPAPVPAVVSLPSMDAAGAGIDAQQAVAAGFRCLKVKLGSADVEADLAVVRAVRQSVGPEVEVMGDYNQVLTVRDATERVKALDAEGLAWIEEPTAADDDAGHAAVAQAAQTPIALGENWWSAAAMARSLAAGACRHAILDAARIGGVTGWLRASAHALKAQVPVSSHGYPEVSAHLMRVTPTLHRLSYSDHLSTIMRQPLPVVQGHVLVPDAPGIGIRWDEERIASIEAAG